MRVLLASVLLALAACALPVATAGEACVEPTPVCLDEPVCHEFVCIGPLCYGTLEECLDPFACQSALACLHPPYCLHWHEGLCPPPWW